MPRPYDVCVHGGDNDMNKYNPEKHHRRSIRLKGYDYAQPGAYFVTICVQGHVCLFGDVVGGDMALNPFGQVAATYWERIPQNFPNVQLGPWVVMPNHVHGIIIITDAPRRGGAFPNASTNAPDITNAQTPHRQGDTNMAGEGEAFLQPPEPEMVVAEARAVYQENPDAECNDPTAANAPSGSLGAIIANYKSVTTRRINKMRHTPGKRVWQRNYWEHIIRTPKSHARIADYILDNPARWEADQLHPDAPPNPFNQDR